MDKLLEKIKDFVTKDIFQILLGLALVTAGFNAFKSFGVDISNDVLKWIFVSIGALMGLPSILRHIYNFIWGGNDDKDTTQSDEFFKNNYRPILKQYLETNKFHYIALVVDNKKIIFDDNILVSNPALQSMLSKGTEAHLKKYREYSTTFSKSVQELDDKLDRIVEEGDLIRLVFDVEQGGFFLGKVLAKQKVYIFAVNIIQDNMDDCTKLMGELMDKIRVDVHKLAPWAMTKRP